MAREKLYKPAFYNRNMAKKGRPTKEAWKVYKNVFDEFTLQTLFRLGSQGHFTELRSPITVGKESNVFTAEKGSKTVVVKIYRLQSCDFNRMFDYIKYDPRYGKLGRQKRKIIFAWVQREYRNLLKARDAGVKVPIPLAFMNNVLVLELIGDKEPAPKLKDQIPKNPKVFFNKIVKNMKKLYDAGLVHADLSSFNILNHKETPVLIDFSQCTHKTDPNAKLYLERDIRNIANFFKKHGVTIDTERVKKEIIT